MNLRLHQLAGKWFHSHEEDTGDQMVFRREGFRFPPSRGRMGFEILPDGRACYFPIGAGDELQSQEVFWKVDSRGELIISHGDRTLFHGSLQGLEETRLEIRVSSE